MTAAGKNRDATTGRASRASRRPRMSRRLGIAVIGAGRAGRVHADNFAAGRIPGAALVALADPADECRLSAARALGVSAAYSDYGQALRDERVDAVVIATPTALHCEIALAAARAGKHILCEKPMAMNVAECDLMIRAAARRRVKLQIGFMRRFETHFLEAWNRIRNGEIGDVVMVRSLTYGPSVPKPWMYDIRTSNGPLAEVNSHDIDTLRWFTGSEFEEVYAIAGNYRCPDARAKFPDFYDNVLMTVRFENGMQGSISGAQGVQYGYDARCEVLGEKGLITVAGLAGDLVLTKTGAPDPAAVPQSWTKRFEDAYAAEDRDFVQCILEDRNPRATGLDGRMAVKAVTAGNRSIVERRPVKLMELGE